ncbi:NF038104 family lipoprotein [Henriciella aquimarina]|uniref:NF038104 family lipoprotein n=1 Tax=Henriciella aquimarina TaxID=545261 RepID=UPI00117B481F|nr:NF038104 family lipoprotein [Henriciella aquimarina]
MTRYRSALLLLATPLLLSGCIVGGAVRVAGDVAEGAVNVTGAAVDAAIPDGDKDEKRKKQDG